MRAAALALFLAPGLTASASSHCFSVWHYPTPQHCATVKTPDHSWFVEIVPPIPPKDTRTQDEKDQAEHDAAVREHKDELNELLRELKAEEEMKAAIPEQKP